MATDDGWIKAVEAYLRDAAGGPGQKREAFAAAREIAGAIGPFGDVIRDGFWAWLTSGKWLNQVPSEAMMLEGRSHLSEEVIREIYRTERGMRFDFGKAEGEAVQAYNARVRRCVVHLGAGWPRGDCLGFVYGRDEWQEALDKARIAAA